MAHVPEGATLIANPVSTAPGFQIGNVFVLAGVPAICRAMFDGLKGRLKTGDKVKIQPAALGSFLMSGPSKRSTRVTRVQ